MEVANNSVRLDTRVQPPDVQDHRARVRDQELMCLSVMLATQPTQAKG